MNIQFIFGPKVRRVFAAFRRNIIHTSPPALSGKYRRNRLQLRAFHSYSKIPYPKASYRVLLLHYRIFSSPIFCRIKEVAGSSVGVATSLLTGSQQNCFSVPAAPTDYFQHQGNNTICGVDISCHSKGTGRPPEELCDLGVQLTAHLHLVLQVRLRGAILPMPHIHMWLTANIMIASALLDKN
jgi:hypothetical protein